MYDRLHMSSIFGRMSASRVGRSLPSRGRGDYGYVAIDIVAFLSARDAIRRYAG